MSELDVLYQKCLELIRGRDLDGAERIINQGISLLDLTSSAEMGKIFDFRNIEEFVLYVNISRNTDKDTKCSWERNFVCEFYNLKAYILHERGLYEEAIEWLKRALEWNPIGVQLRFELVENYNKLKDYDASTGELAKISKRVIMPNEVAGLYRRYGFICIENKDYELAKNFFMYSLIFEDNASVYGELKYIEQRTNEKIERIDVNKAEEFLKKNEMNFKVTKAAIDSLMELAEIFIKEHKYERAQMYYKIAHLYTKDKYFLNKVKEIEGITNNVN